MMMTDQPMQRDPDSPPPRPRSITVVEFRNIRAQRLDAFSTSLEAQIAAQMALGVRKFKLAHAEEGQLKYADFSVEEKSAVQQRVRERFSAADATLEVHIYGFTDENVELSVIERGSCCF